MEASSSNATSGNANSFSESGDGVPPNKLARLDMQRAREQFSARLDAPKIKKATSNLLAPGTDTSTTSTSISEAMSQEKIAALKVSCL